MKLYFVRHGESTANVLMEFSNNESTHPLTEKGITQARTLAQHLAAERFARIYASPVLRAVQTAQILAEELAAPLEISASLREWSVGIYEGSRDPLGWEKHRQVQEDWFIHNQPDSRMPGGESLLDIQARFDPLINSLVQDKQLANQNVLLVAHGGLYLAMLPAILENIDYPFAHRQGFPNAAVALAEKQPDGRLVCLSWCGSPPPDEPWEW